MKKLTILLFSILMTFSTYSFGVVNYSVYEQEQLKSSPTLLVLDALLNGTESGFLWANTELASEGRKKLYCQPGGLKLNLQTIKDILEEKVKNLLKLGWSLEEVDDFPIQLILLEGLKDTFPCE